MRQSRFKWEKIHIYNKMSVFRQSFFSFYCFQKPTFRMFFPLLLQGFEKVIHWKYKVSLPSVSFLSVSWCENNRIFSNFPASAEFSAVMESHGMFSHQLTLREETDGRDTLYFQWMSFSKPWRRREKTRKRRLLKTIKREKSFV